MLKILKPIKKPVLIGEVSCNHNGYHCKIWS